MMQNMVAGSSADARRKFSVDRMSKKYVLTKIKLVRRGKSGRNIYRLSLRMRRR